MADQCIVCLETLDVEPSTPLTLQQLPPAVSSSSCSDPDASLLGPSGHSGPAGASAADKPRNTEKTPTTPEQPLNVATAALDLATHNEDTRIAVIDACGHTLHDACLREWTGKANSCPICRQAFHLVRVYDKIGGKLLLFDFMYVFTFRIPRLIFVFLLTIRDPVVFVSCRG